MSDLKLSIEVRKEEKGLVLLEIRSKGKSVFATEIFKKGEKITNFDGDLFTGDQLPETESDGISNPSRYMQIGKNLYQGPSSNLETFTNHSCDPNCGVVINGVKAILVAIKDIFPGEEITWDYSTTIDDDTWFMKCACDADICRKKIGEFKNIPKNIQKKYIDLGIIPNYVIESLVFHCVSKKIRK